MNPPNAVHAAVRQTDPAPALHLKLRDDVTIAVPPSLSSITTYVLLEQEAWFEKEIDFLGAFLKPGMTAIDIGANLGVYSLPMARLVGPGGRIFAYEPGGEARALLERSRDVNGFDNLEVLGLALSDRAREGHLGFADSSELRALGAGSGEPVRITSLDLENVAHAWPAIDFIKIDAEGEEERIIAGGEAFFARQSPLVMFEIKAGNAVNERLRQIYPAMGYTLFRQLGGAPILVPADLTKPLDGYELNLFAAKPDRMQTLAERGLLVEAVPDWRPEPGDLERAVSFWQRQPFASLVKLSEGSGLSADKDYQNALIGYAVWRAAELPIAARCAALAFALQSARGLRTRGDRGARFDLGADRRGVGRAQRKHHRAATVDAASAGPAVAGTVLAGGRAFRRTRRWRSAVGLVRCRCRRAARADLQLLVRVRRRFAHARLAVRSAVCQRGNGAPAGSRGGGRGNAAAGAATAVRAGAGPCECGNLARGEGARNGAVTAPSARGAWRSPPSPNSTAPHAMIVAAAPAASGRRPQPVFVHN